LRPISCSNLHPITRRSVLVGAAASAAALAWPAWAADDLAGTTLRVATYGGSWRDSIVKFILPDLIASGVTVDFTVGSPDDNLARLIAAKRQGQIPFDTIDPSALSYRDAVRAGFFAPIEYDRIANAHFAPSWARDDRQMTALFTAEGLVYHAERLKTAGVAPPAHYSDLADPKLRGHVAFPDTGHPQHWNAVVALARESGGDEGNMKGALDRVNEIAPSYFYNSSIELASRMSSGDIWAAVWHGGWAVRLKRAGVPVSVVYPKIGDHIGALWPSTRSVIAGTRNVAGAHAYLNAWMAVEGPYKFCEDTGSVPVNPLARARMADDADNRAMLPLTDAQLESCYRIDWSRMNEKTWRDQWNRGIHR
jgi:putative spermidine/putrescine transport system substrate-binding protein